MNSDDSIADRLNAKIAEELMRVEQEKESRRLTEVRRLEEDALTSVAQAAALAPIVAAFGEIAKSVNDASLVTSKDRVLSFNRPENHAWILGSSDYRFEEFRNRQCVRRIQFRSADEIIEEAICLTAAYLASVGR